MDLDKFGRALRLHWLWQEWHTYNKLWSGLEISCTTVTIGNGKMARFWHHVWLDGEAPRNLAPQLFDLVQRKNKTVAQELTNNSWISALQNKIASADQLEELVSFWIRIQKVHLYSELRGLNHLEMDTRCIYSARSTYRAQFIGSFRSFKIDII